MSLPLLVKLLLLIVAQSHGAKILGLFPFPARSHLIVHRALMFELASRGHQVTVVSPFPENKPIANYTDIAVNSDIYAVTGGHGEQTAGV
jgi:glucuronosyltransferase